MSYRDYEPVDLARADFKIHQLEGLEKDNVENAFAGYIKGVLGRINDGKEATVYLCEADQDDEWLAAKVFKPRNFRHFGTDRKYRNLGKMRDRRKARLMRHHTEAGDAAFHRDWIRSEWDSLNRLADAGVRVPRPVALSADGVLMTFIGDDTGPAPRLVNCELDADALATLVVQLQAEIGLMLDIGIVHGDLSPYNILYFDNAPVIIDVPQAVDVATHPDAINMMARDLGNLDTWFERKGVASALSTLLGRMY